MDFYWKDKPPFQINGLSYDIKKVMHSDFNKDEYLIFVVDKNNEDSKYLMKYK